jgi:hypothetical protein
MNRLFQNNPPWRTRGAFDPNDGGAFPLVGDISVLTGEPIELNDAFVIESACPQATLLGVANYSAGVPAGGAVPGDYLVYAGGDPTVVGSWVYAPGVLDKDNVTNTPYVVVLAQRNPSFP